MCSGVFVLLRIRRPPRTTPTDTLFPYTTLFRSLNSYETAMLRNEALSNDGLLPEFTQQDLELFRSGEDPYGHPDVNWYDVIFKPYSLQANTNVDISGGSEAVK